MGNVSGCGAEKDNNLQRKLFVLWNGAQTDQRGYHCVTCQWLLLSGSSEFSRCVHSISVSPFRISCKLFIVHNKDFMALFRSSRFLSFYDSSIAVFLSSRSCLLGFSVQFDLRLLLCSETRDLYARMLMF